MGVADENDEFVRLLANSGWKQARAAKELGLRTSTVSRYVSGQTKPSIQVLRLFAGILSEKLLLPGEPTPSFSDGPRWLEDWEADALAVLRRVEPKRRRRAISAIKELLEAFAGHGSIAPRPIDPVTDSERIVADTVAALTSTDSVPVLNDLPSMAAPSPLVSSVRRQHPRNPKIG